jgi:dTDP-glucose 4,6-dehydratase
MWSFTYAESYFDRSIDEPAVFLETNISNFLLQEAPKVVATSEMDAFRFLHVSTDKVFGSLGQSGRFTEQSPYCPNSPYAASKTASDHLVHARHHRFELPIAISKCSDNFGPYQFSEKADPHMRLNESQSRSMVRAGMFATGCMLTVTRALCCSSPRRECWAKSTVSAPIANRKLDVVKKLCTIVD